MFKEANILFVTHTSIPLFLSSFREFTSPKCNVFTVISHPLIPIRGTRSKFSVYKKNKLQKYTTFYRIPVSYSLNFLKDFFLTIFWGVKNGFIYDIGIGTNNLNTLSLLILKKLGRIKKVIFINIDYTPNRYDNPIFNGLYHWFDRICCYSADILWNGTSRTNQARAKNGVDMKRIAHAIIMPDGSYFDPKKRLSIDKIDRKKLIFLGNMRPVMGVELILESFREIVKEIPDAKLLLIGGGSKLEEYKKLASKLKLEKHAFFTGFIEKHEDVDSLLCTGAVGLAPFVPDKTSYEFYSDVGKPKAYLAAGMPVIITRVPQIADEIEKKKAGIAINYNKKELINAIILLLLDDKLYREYRKNAVKLSKKYMWENIFAETFKETFDFFEKAKKR